MNTRYCRPDRIAPGILLNTISVVIEINKFIRCAFNSKKDRNNDENDKYSEHNKIVEIMTKAINSGVIFS